MLTIYDYLKSRYESVTQEQLSEFGNLDFLGEVTQGEDEVGTMTEHQKKIFWILRTLQVDAHLKAEEYKKCKDKERDKALELELSILYSQVEAIKQLFWNEVQIHFSVFDGKLTIRRNWKIVKLPDTEDSGPIIEIIATGRF